MRIFRAVPDQVGVKDERQKIDCNYRADGGG